MIKKLAIFGTSGFAHEVADIAYAQRATEVVLLTNDNNANNINSHINILPESKIEELHQQGFSFSIGIGSSSTRRKVYQKFTHLNFPNIVHPKATFGFKQEEILSSTIGNIITAGVVITNNVLIGDFGIYNLNTTVGHDCIIGDFVSIMPSVNISGNVQINQGAFIGVGAIILQGDQNNKMLIGENSVIGAASLVTKNVPDNLTVFGCPAKPLKKR